MNRSLIDLFFRHFFAEIQTFKNGVDIVICPTYCFLEYVGQFCFQQAAPYLKLGAQDCSQFTDGAYTGQVPATDLKSVGCAYAIVGHAERRVLFCEDDAVILEKVKRLLAVNITPIICIGPLQCTDDTVDVCVYVKNQIAFFMDNVDVQSPLLFAYEPYLAIGSDAVLAVEAIAVVMDAIQEVIHNYSAQGRCSGLYGGNVNEESIKHLRTISSIDGFLIGRASIDFQKLKNIISY